MENWFLHGPMCHAPVLRSVLRRAVAGVPAVLRGHALHRIEGRALAVLVPSAAGVVGGILLTGLRADDQARLAFYEAATGQAGRETAVEAGGAPIFARVAFAPDAPGALWDFDDWQRRYGATAAATAADVMARFGLDAPGAVVLRYDLMLVRGASRVRAMDAAPTALRHAAAPGDVRVDALRQPYARFFAVEEVDVSFRRFDGAPSPVVTRATFVMGDAVTVLPYDARRDRVLVIQQFRAGPLGRGDAQPWLIEAIAGRIDPGETPAEAARREAVEEAGLALDALLPVAQYYPSPGAVTEFIYSYVALVDLPDGMEGVFGVEGEAEDIRGHLIGFDQLMSLVASGEVANAPLILTALWLQRERGALRAMSRT